MPLLNIETNKKPHTQAKSTTHIPCSAAPKIRKNSKPVLSHKFVVRTAKTQFEKMNAHKR